MAQTHDDTAIRTPTRLVWNGAARGGQRTAWPAGPRLVWKGRRARDSGAVAHGACGWHHSVVTFKLFIYIYMHDVFKHIFN